jgi:hypothetical protein
MRNIYISLLLIVSFSCLSQNKQVLYNLTTVPQSLLVNPGTDFKYNKYMGVPLFSGISLNVGSSGFSVYDLFAKGGVNFETKLRNVLSSTSRNDKVSLNEQLEVFNGGFKVGNWQKHAYVSFGMYQEFDFLLYMPQDLAILALDGNRDPLTGKPIDKKFNLGDLNLKAEMLSVFHIGYHKNITDKLIVGARGKIYSSIFNATSTNNSGYILTEEGTSTGTFYEQNMESDVEVKTSGIVGYIKAENYVEDNLGDPLNPVTEIPKKVFLGGDLGLGFDLGFSYYPKKNIQITASILDVGFINHTKEVRTYTYKGIYKYEGINPDFEDSNSPGNVYQEFQDAIPLDSIDAKYTTWRPQKLNASYQYSYDGSGGGECSCDIDDSDYKNSVGAQFFMMTAPRAPIMALTGFYKTYVLPSLQMKATYTVDSYSYTNIGLGLSTKVGMVHLYVLADNLLEYRDISKANSLSFQFGLNFVFKENNDPL